MDNAFEKARAAYGTGAYDDTTLEFLFPKLKESEDERVRKLLVWQVYRNIEDETNDLAGSVYDGIKGHDPDLEESIEDWKKCLAWLEKQKEPIPIPDKFSGLKSLMLQYLQSAANRKDDTEIESDTDLWGRKILDYVWKYDEKQKEQPQEELVYRLNGLMQEYVKEGKDEAEKEHRFKCYQLFWDALEDANFFEQKEQKPAQKFRVGDMIISTKNPHLTYKILEVGHINELGNPEYKVEIFEDGKPGILNKPHNIHYFECHKVDEWGKLIEQKPAEWSEEDKQWLSEVYFVIDHSMYSEDERQAMKKYIDSLRSQSKTTEWSEEDEKILERFLGWLQGTMGEKTYSSWLKSLRERFNLQPNPAWSEEDEDYYDAIIVKLEVTQDDAMLTDEQMSFLKSIPERFNLQPAEWGEKDKRKLNRIYEILDYAADDKAFLKSKRIIGDKEAIELQDFLRSLRPSWRPSEEQMEALKKVTGNAVDADEYYPALATLYYELKEQF